MLTFIFSVEVFAVNWDDTPVEPGAYAGFFYNDIRLIKDDWAQIRHQPSDTILGICVKVSPKREGKNQKLHFFTFTLDQRSGYMRTYTDERKGSFNKVEGHLNEETGRCRDDNACHLSYDTRGIRITKWPLEDAELFAVIDRKVVEGYSLLKPVSDCPVL